MSSYFDGLQRQLYEARAETHGNESDADFRQTLIAVDAQLCRDVLALVDDREFPADLRDKMKEALARRSCWHPVTGESEHNIERGTALSCSRAVDVLHELFHELARRRVKTRFCVYLSDSPAHMAVLKNDFENGFGEETD